MIGFLAGCGSSPEGSADVAPTVESVPTVEVVRSEDVDGGGTVNVATDRALSAAMAVAPLEFGDVGDVVLPEVDGVLVEAWSGRHAVLWGGLLEQSEALWNVDDADCAAVGEGLNPVGTPEDFVASVEALPDGHTADVLGGLYRAVARALMSCGSDDFEVRRSELAWQWAMGARVVDQIVATP